MADISKAYIIQDGPYDFTDVERFGEAELLSSVELGSLLESSQNRTIMERMALKLAGYRPGIDYIVACGSPVAVAFVFMLLGRGPHRVLKWDQRAYQYGLYDFGKIEENRDGGER